MEHINIILINLKERKDRLTRCLDLFNNYFDILDSVFFQISRTIKDNIQPKELLDGSVCISGIRSNY